MSANVINKAGVLGDVNHISYCYKFGNCIICTNVVSRACVLGDVNHAWYCCIL